MTRGNELAILKRKRPADMTHVILLVVMMMMMPAETIASSAAPVVSSQKYADHNATIYHAKQTEAREGSGKMNEEKKNKKNDLVLTKLLVIARHGHRAPNAAYWQMCPKDVRNRRKYVVDAEDLTGLGMKEEYNFGQYLRHKYRHFIGVRFNRSLHFFRAVGEPRILQSSLAMAQGLFPDGFGPGGYLPGRPQFVPVFSDMDTHEYLLDDVPCFRRAEADMRHWLRNKLEAFTADPNVAEVVAYMKKVCGASKAPEPPLYAFLKTVSDGMTFNTDYGLRVCGGRVTSDMLFRIRNVSLQLLLSRLYHTDEQRTYTAVDLPHRLLRIMHHVAPPAAEELNNFYDTQQESIFYFVHREALYAISEFFGFVYNVPGLPNGELPVASSLLVERLVPAADIGHSKPTVYVRLVLWTPNDGTSAVEVPQCNVPQLCKLDELKRIYTKRVARTGTWDKLCNFSIQELDHHTDIR